MTAISQQDWQDQEDGRALRELREALPGMHRDPDDAWTVVVHLYPFVGPTVQVWNGYEWRNRAEVAEASDTIADAADACRAALRERAA